MTMNHPASQSYIKLVAQSFGRRKMAVACAYILLGLYAAALCAPLIAPYGYADEQREFSFCPPTSVEWFDQGRLVWPFVYGRTMHFDQNHRRVFEINRDQKYALKLFSDGKLLSVESPGRFYWLGADSRGRDIFSRLLHAGRISLSIGLLGVTISFVLGLIIGGIAGYYGGWVDSVLMRICEMFMLVPGFYLMLALRSAVPDNFSSLQIYCVVVVILSLIGWASLARVIRGMALSLRERDYVQAAKLLGLSDTAIIIRHILPHTISYSMVAVMLAIPGYIMGEAGLSLIGLGIQDPVPSWGNMLSDAMGIAVIKLAPWLLWPGLLIFITVVCFNVIGDALRDALDPLFNKDQ